MRCLHGFLPLFGLSLLGCASTPARPPLSAYGSSWDALAELQRGEHVVVTIECPGAGREACEQALRTSTQDRFPFIEAAFIEVNVGDVLVRPSREATVLALPRAIVVAVDAQVDDEHLDGTLIGIAAGLGVCALAGCFTVHDIVFLGRLMFAGMFAGGGAAVGYGIDRTRRTWRRIYSRPGANLSPRRKAGREAPEVAKGGERPGTNPPPPRKAGREAPEAPTGRGWVVGIKKNRGCGTRQPPQTAPKRALYP